MFYYVVPHYAKETQSSEVLARGCSGTRPALKLSHLLHSLLSMLVVTAIRVSRVKPQILLTSLCKKRVEVKLNLCYTYTRNIIQIHPNITVLLCVCVCLSVCVCGSVCVCLCVCVQGTY